jgi:hypothetical protein
LSSIAGGTEMKGILVCLTIALMMFMFIGCGDDSSEEPLKPVDEIKPGLSGNTYWNTKFGIKITNLPVDSWTVKALGKDGLGFLMPSEEGTIPLYNLMLIEPVPADKFVGFGEGSSLNPLFDANIPFIWIAVDYLEGGNFESHNLAEDINQYAESYSYNIESKKPIYVGNSAGYQVILDFGYEDWKDALTWFAKGEVNVRYELIAKKADLDKYFSVYENVLKNTTLMGK